MDRKIKKSKSAATIRRRTKRSSSTLFGNFFSYKQTSVADPFESDGQEDDWSERDHNDSASVIGPVILKGILSSKKKLFWSLMALRFLNAIVIQTSYVPDEYWQSTEVAHNMVFGYGYLTWEWKRGIRSYFYPLIFAVLYKFLAIFHMDSRFLMIKGPRLVQAIFAAFGDLYVYRLSIRLSGVQVARWTLFCQLTSWFIFYTSTRTLTNSMEEALTSVALYYYPWPGKAKKGLWKYLLLVCVAVIIRPTAAVTWLPLLLWHLFTWRHLFWRVIRYSVERGIIVLFVSTIVDRIFYGEWVNVHYNFLHFNILSGLSAFYGSHPWHWYLTQGLPVILGTHLIILLIALWKRREPMFLVTVSWSVFVYSLLGHKEFRFLLGVMPHMMHLCGCMLHEAFTSSSQRKDYSDKRTSYLPQGQTLKVFTMVALLAVNIPLALYFSLIHQRGTVDVMSFVHKESQKQWPYNGSLSVLYLMPCHSTPYYSYVHKNVTMYFLTCQPNLDTYFDSYKDEADQFYDNPESWLTQRYSSAESFNSSMPLPTHIVMYDELYLRIPSWLQKHNFHLCDRFFHTHFPEGRVSNFVVVVCQHALPLPRSQNPFALPLPNSPHSASQ